MVEGRILVVRLGAMGDILHATPAVASLKQSFPHHKVTWVIDAKWAALLEGNPFVDEVTVVSRRSLSSLLELRRTLRNAAFDFAVDFQGLIKSAMIAACARPDRIYGFSRSQARERLASLFYSHPVKTQSAHIVDRNIEIAQAAGARNIVRTFYVPTGRPEGDLPAGPFVLANPYAGWESKQWPAANYQELAKRLASECDLPLVLNVPPGANAIPGAHMHVSGIQGLIESTRRAVAVVGLDSGPMHLAAALGKPGVAIFGPTDPSRNGPYGNSFAVLRSPGAVTSYKRRREIDPAMQSITVDAVLASLKAQIKCAAGS
jgi:heptosyltransferase-1